MKKIVITIIALVLLCAIMSGCSTMSGTQTNSSNSLIKSIPDSESLSYRTDTKVIYIIFHESMGYYGYGYMAPYISENGNYCKYIDGKIIEIEK